MEHTEITVPESQPRAQKQLVNPVALRGCFAELDEEIVPITDISFLRVNLAVNEANIAKLQKEPFAIRLHLERHQLLTHVQLSGQGDGWIRLALTKIVPSVGAHLRAFLSPKRVGESVIEDWQGDNLRHYHGLNESELWFDSEGQILFSYLDSVDYRYQFVLRLPESKAALQIGRIPREEYIQLDTWGADIYLEPLNDRDVFQKLSECRDIATNFRTTGQHDYQLKQRLLKVISDALYSTGRRVAMAPPRVSANANRPPTTTSSTDIVQ